MLKDSLEQSEQILNQALERYEMGNLKYWFYKWQTRALGSKLDRIIALLPIFICIGISEDWKKTIQNARRVVFTHIRSKRVAHMVFRCVMFKAKKYFENQEEFLEDKQKAYEMITQNIQMFALVLDVLDGISRELGRSTMIVKKGYEETYEMNAETKRLLQYQERRYFSNENTIE